MRAHILNPANISIGVNNGAFSLGESITEHFHPVATEGITIVHYGTVQCAEYDVSWCHGKGVVAVNRVVATVRGAYLHLFRTFHNIDNARRRFSPGSTTVVAVFNLDDIAGIYARSCGFRPQSGAVVQLGGVVTYQRDGQILGHSECAFSLVDDIVVGDSSAVEGVGERIGTIAYLGLASGHIVGCAFVSCKAVTRNKDSVVDERSSIVGLAAVTSSEIHMSRCHRKGTPRDVFVHLIVVHYLESTNEFNIFKIEIFHVNEIEAGAHIRLAGG